MKYLALVLFVLGAGNVASACPTLPDNAGVEWIEKQGADFEVCYANEKGSNKTAFGVYFGEHPAFREKKVNMLGKGRVAGREVTWYKSEPPDHESPLGRETVIAIDKRYGALAHLWVRAASEAELERRLAVLEKIVFED